MCHWVEFKIVVLRDISGTAEKDSAKKVKFVIEFVRET
jgi:hypothetical protein